MTQIEEKYMRRAFAVALNARAKGDHPFGAILVDPDGEIILEAENSVVTAQDCTGHAETNLMRAASNQFSAEFLSQCTFYTSTEPCPMCSGAIFWGNVRRVVFGLSEEKLYEMVDHLPNKTVLYLPCREVFARANLPTEVIGPILEAEAAEVHAGFW